MNFAYLNLRDHPRGNAILQTLLKNGFIPSLVIEENSSLATKSRNNIIKSFEETSQQFPLTRDIISDMNLPLFYVDNHNSLACENLLKNRELDLIVLGDARIIKRNIMAIPRIGIINSHPGYLPDVRGNNPYIWAIINDLPQGCSVHFIDNGIDTGDILLRELIDVKSFNTYADLLEEINILCSDLILKAVKQIFNDKYIRTPQSKLSFIKKDHTPQEFKAASEEIKRQAILKLQKRTR